ncbi:TPA: hypothetical protein QCQ70_004368 [Bacillus cytotoxicus]|uniref:hypothetical protein n=1 Tax=Bacillus cytotoxicus TaxID=580165 RepID=UPI001AEE4FB8|nr:hypothetical protein [Bacillus cytotoxicus]QTR73039.1 hypothetical protein JC775_20400 [Bacillus cytotoxicus]HDR4573544.1 hypothetical protein [Bacillus cytotoxicus]HDR4589623.1 hypothetical protein [Bacillus cytotoxicus]
MTNAILSGLGKVGSVISKGFGFLWDLLEKPLGYLLAFLEGIFYFFACLFKVVVLIVKIFTALFQFFWVLASSVLKTLLMWIGIAPSGSVHLPKEIHNGFDVVVQKLMPTGLMTIVPTVATAFLWLYFGLKVFSLYGGSMGFSFPERKK